MNAKKIIVLILVVLISALIGPLAQDERASAAPDVVVIVNKNIPSLSALEIRRIFTGAITSWPGAGGSIKVLLNSDSYLYSEFCSKYLGMDTTRADQIWVYKQVREGIPTPRKVSSSVIKSMVSHSNSFIGFIKRSEADAGVKIVGE